MPRSSWGDYISHGLGVRSMRAEIRSNYVEDRADDPILHTALRYTACGGRCAGNHSSPTAEVLGGGNGPDRSGWHRSVGCLFYPVDRAEAGDVIPGSGGASKLRWAAKGKGKRGGALAAFNFFAQALRKSRPMK